MAKYKTNSNDDYDQLFGKAGIVYILANKALAVNLYKIGATQQSGALRAIQINKEASTGIPAEYACIFECNTSDCGRSERLIHEKFDKSRRGKHGFKRNGEKWGQEFFELENLEQAKIIIIEICKNAGMKQQPLTPNTLSQNIPRYQKLQTATVERVKRTNTSIKLATYGIFLVILTMAIITQKEDKITSNDAQTQPPQAKKIQIINSYDHKKTLPSIPTTTHANSPLDSTAKHIHFFKDKQVAEGNPVVTKTNDTFYMEWEEKTLHGTVHKIAEIKGNRSVIAKEISEAKKSNVKSNYYGKREDNAGTKSKCEFKTVMTNQEIKNCQSQHNEN